jgi:hypothetical protein
MRSPVPRTFASLVPAVLVLAMIPAVAGPASVPPNYDASQRRLNEAENAVAVNPTNPQNVVAMSTRPDVPKSLFEAVSFDGGITWTHQVIGSGPPLGEICCDEQIAFDRFGNLFMTYLVNTNGDTFVAVSTDGGLTFGRIFDIVPIAPPGAPSGRTATRRRAGPPLTGASADQPSISVGSDSVWVSYTVDPGGVIQAAGAHIDGLGAVGPFSRPQDVPGRRGVGGFGDTAVGPDGSVVVVYQNPTDFETGASIFTALDPDGLGPAGFKAPRLLARTKVGGFDYIPAQPHRSIDAEANLAWDRSSGPHHGRLYAIWTQETPDESNNTDIMLQSSDDSGATWTSPVRLNDDATTNSQFNPAVALDQTTGAVAISWYDARNDLGAGGPGDTNGKPNDDVQIWATYSKDGGATFAPNVRVSLGTSNAVAAASDFDFGDYTRAAFQSGVFIPSWSDNSNSTGDNPDGSLYRLDLYVARVVIP